MDKGLMEQDNMDNLGFKDVVDPASTETKNPAAAAAAYRAASQGRGARSGLAVSYAGDTHGVERHTNSAKAGSGSAADESNRDANARANANGHVSRQDASYAGDSHAQSGTARLV